MRRPVSGRSLSRYVPIVLLLLVLPLVGVLAGRWALFAPGAPAAEDVRMPGLSAPVLLRRDALGIPRIEAQAMPDLAQALGWVMAEDRYAQMASLRLLAQGRLAELAGEAALGLDVFLRSLDLDAMAQQQLAALPEDSRVYLEDFSAGVNAWLAAHAEDLPPTLRLAGHLPEPWTPLDSLRLQTLLAQALGFNLHEELAFLQAAARVGASRAAWLFPIYPDEPLDFAEAGKLEGLSLRVPAIEQLPEMAGWLGAGALAASNNWALRPERTAAGASLLANDTHLLLTQPSVWMAINLALPDQQVAGVALAGVPLVVAGTNQQVAWGLTMAMADTQDLFLERLVFQEGQWFYETPEGWERVQSREALFRVRGEAQPRQLTLQSTRHGPLLNEALRRPSRDPLQPEALRSEYGLALQTTLRETTTAFDAMRRMNWVPSLDDAIKLAGAFDAAALNVVLADAQHIAWVLSGRLPQRASGTGHFPSPGWSGEYDWQSTVDESMRPLQIDPPTGYLVTANHRTLKRDAQPWTISSSWYGPERHDRIVQRLLATPEHDLASTRDIQLDQTDPMVAKVQRRWRDETIARALHQAIDELPPAQGKAARSALEQLLSWDGRMAADSSAAALWGVFEHELTRALFLDELGPEESPAWQAFVRISSIRYSAAQDHLLGRPGSPFWDNRNTGVVESRFQIVAESLARSVQWLSDHWGEDPRDWQWGQLHQYHWRSGASRLLDAAAPWERWLGQWFLAPLDRGPWPAGGNRHTVNVAGYSVGQDFEVWNVPAMRMIVDFSLAEPLHLAIAGGQSDDPRSPHYADGIAPWREGLLQPVPLVSEAARAHYTHQRVLIPE